MAFFVKFAELPCRYPELAPHGSGHNRAMYLEESSIRTMVVRGPSHGMWGVEEALYVIDSTSKPFDRDCRGDRHWQISGQSTQINLI